MPNSDNLLNIKITLITNNKNLNKNLMPFNNYSSKDKINFNNINKNSMKNNKLSIKYKKN